MSTHDSDELVNEVTLVGRVSLAPTGRELPSGDQLWTFRVVVPRPPVTRPRRAESGRRGGMVDALDCAVWTAGARRTVKGWREGDVVRVSGAVRRRFFRSGAGSASRVEIEVTGGQLIRRAATA
jgi:single-strand DNA-binding protein